MSLHLVDALNDKTLFAPYFSGDSWNIWKVFLKCLPLPSPIPLSAEELEIFRRFTGRSWQPEIVREAYTIVGRGSGKTRVAATAAVFTACFRGDLINHLAPGQVAVISLQATDRRQAKELFNYVYGLISSVPALSRMITAETKESITLTTRCTIEVRVSSFKSVRGPSYPLVIADELSFWWNDEMSSNPDIEVVRALRPGLGRIPNSLLLGLSSPYARRGHLWEMYSRHYGRDDSNILIWCADTKSMNPSFSHEVIAEAFEQDESSALAEYGRDGKTEFRKDVESFVSREVVEQAVVSGRHELPYCSEFTYEGFTDPSGGSSDSFTIAIGHNEQDKAILDVCREVKPPFSPQTVVEEFSALLKEYRIHRVSGDRYSGEFVRELFRKNEITYEPSDKSKSEIYKNFLGMLNSGGVVLLDNPKMLNQLCALERKTGSSRDVIDHPPNAHDDLCNAAAGALLLASENAGGGIRCLEFSLFGSCGREEEHKHFERVPKPRGHSELPPGMF